MVLLTQTPTTVTALKTYSHHHPLSTLHKTPSEPNLNPPTPGAPITHAQLLQLHTSLKTLHPNNHPHLPTLLHNARVYIPPPPPKKQPTTEYTALMARLRQENEAREYARMTTPSTGLPTAKNPFARFAAPQSALAWDLGPSTPSPFSSSSSPTSKAEETATAKEIDAQISLIVNVLISIIACGVTFFLLLRYTRWEVGVRVLFSMGVAVVVGVAEVGVYAGFLRRVGEGRRKEGMRMGKGGKGEVRRVVGSWVIEGEKGEKMREVGGGDECGADDMVEKKISIQEENDAVRRRRRRRRVKSEVAE